MPKASFTKQHSEKTTTSILHNKREHKVNKTKKINTSNKVVMRNPIKVMTVTTIKSSLLLHAK
jgi:hypothetical protein